jgi:DNA-binding MarR family transcriptional regulator
LTSDLEPAAGAAPRDPAALDRLIHEPARLVVVAILATAAEADFVFLQKETGLTAGNLSSHLARLEEAGYVAVEKSFRGKVPYTVASLTMSGRRAFDAYRRQLRLTLGEP